MRATVTWTGIILAFAMGSGLLVAVTQIKKPKKLVPFIQAVLVRIAILPMLLAGLLLATTKVGDWTASFAQAYPLVRMVFGIAFVIGVIVLAWTVLPMIHDVDPPDWLVTAAAALPLLATYRPSSGIGRFTYDLMQPTAELARTQLATFLGVG